MIRSTFKLSVLIGSLVLFTACENGEEENGNNNRVRQIPVETIIIEADRFDDFIRLSGSAEAIDDAVLSSEVSGQVLEIANRGERVNRGAVIARIDDRIIRTNLSSAEAAYNFANDTFQRLEPLYADSIISTQDFRAARTERDAAKAQLEQMQKMLEDTEIRAPFNGRVEERMVRRGELINPGMPVVRLVNADRIRLRAGVPERYSTEIKEGSEVIVSLRTYGGGEYESRISFAGNVIDSERRTFPIEIEMSNRDSMIKPEMVVNIRAKRRSIENAVIIPRTAVVRDESSVSVFVAEEADGNKVARLVEVELGTATGPLIEVIAGLEPGDEVIVAGISALSIGDRLNIVKSETSNERALRLQSSNMPVSRPTAD
ncbi:MAG: efflux RND transporter periplasmic adaptor subunit [Balneolales bacterium]|nr:efflux RND transporter periplasmic adaptor subunit [Balneolales bacterium]